ncbi:hypothetical protein DFH09DRAFT_1299370 [Mycena vulgaris]|nr:hypothetical protein DFH09DRAFT_1299370 [Mycena vulgaris]
MYWAARYAPTFSAPLVEIYDSANKTKLGESFISGSVDETDQARIVRPCLPEEELLLYHQLWRTLLRGSGPFTEHPDSPAEIGTRRPALPVELVRLIMRTAAFMVPDRQQTQHAERSVFLRATTRDEEPVVSRVWFWTKPLNLAKVAAVQLVTVSHDQGWVSPATDVCHSWFEWGVFNGVPEPASGGGEGGVTGNEMVWRTESPKQEGKASEPMWCRTHGNPIARGQYQQHDGPRVGIDDEMWDGAKAGSVIVVRACTQQALWENDARYGEILVWKWFEPVVRVA